MSFPYTVKHRREQVKIYREEKTKLDRRGKKTSYLSYRAYYRHGGKAVLRTFARFGEAREYAETIVRELAKDNQSAALSAKESTDALAIRDVLAEFKRDTGTTITALEAVKLSTSALKLLGGHDLLDAVRAYLRTVAIVKRKNLAEAVREFIAEREPRTIPKKPGERPKLNPIYHRIVERYLTEFADALPGSAVADITRMHVAAYFAAPAIARLAPKSINDRRAALKMFFNWCADVDRYYLPPSHTLCGGQAMQAEDDTPEEILCYTAAELRQMLEAAEGEMRAVIALQALAGLRLQEILRMDWEKHIFASPGHIKVTGDIAKTRSRRVVAVCPALEQWLAPYRGRTGKVWTQTPSDHGCITAMARLRESLEIPSKKNGLRHGFVSAHLAVHQDAAHTAMTAGNSPTVIDAHYKELLTAAEGAAWFAVAPAPAADNVIPISKGKAA